MRWQCLATGHDPLVCETADEFEQHMLDAHEGTFPIDELPFLAEISQHPLSPTVDSCPFCPDITSTSAETFERLEEHVAQHLQEIAIHSLDPPGSEYMGMSDSDGAKLPTRSTVENLRSTLTERLLFYDDDVDSKEEPETRLLEWGGILGADQHAALDTTVFLQDDYEKLADFACERFKMSDATVLVQYLSAPGIGDFLTSCYFMEFAYSFLTTMYGVHDEKQLSSGRALVAISNDMIAYTDMTGYTDVEIFRKQTIYTEDTGYTEDLRRLLDDSALSLAVHCRQMAFSLLNSLKSTEFVDQQGIGDSQIFSTVSSVCSGQGMADLQRDLNAARRMDAPSDGTYR